MKILLAAVNAKYIHTCPAIYSLKAYAEAHFTKGNADLQIETVEYTINDRYQDVLAGILAHKADAIGFSGYIWNVDRIHRLLGDIRKIRGREVMLWVGGPEATWYPEAFLRDEEAQLCMIGEGEVVFTRVAELVFTLQTGLAANHGIPDMETDLEKIPGLAFLKDGEIIRTGMAQLPALDEIPFLYGDLTLFDNRILYYEASRGCPFACAYCLSGRERGTRYRNLEAVRKELQFFLNQKVKQVKFVDRTFNADPDFAMAVWTYIRDHDNGITNFHFEIEADRFTQEELELVSALRPGLIQMEIGVQSSNPETLRSVHRSPKLDRIRESVAFLLCNQNINIHLDLIAGLPYEGLDSFRKSFQAVYEMRPHQLQLGFLKLLKGTELYDRREEYGLVCSEDAPYEVLKTRWLSYEELDLLHRISDRVEEYVNSRGFARSMPLAEELFPDAFSLFEALAEYYRKHGYEQNHPSVQKRYQIFADFIYERHGIIRNGMHCFKSEQEQSGRVTGYPETKPDYSGSTMEFSKAISEMSEKPGCGAEPQLRRILEMIRFDQALHIHPSRRMQTEDTFDFGDGPVGITFDHRNCSPVTGEAKYVICSRGDNDCLGS